MGLICCKPDKSQKVTEHSFRANLVREQKRDYHDFYNVVSLIGESSISNIYKIKKKALAIGGSSRKLSRSNGVDKTVPGTRNNRKKTHGGQVYALKEIDLAFIKKGYVEELRNEIDLLKHLDHPNIIKAYETFIYRKKLSIVLELCSGGDLYTRHP
jgi:serine/threonine protein kinase